MIIPLPSALPEGWFISNSEKTEFLHTELKKELPPGHILYAAQVQIVAHREATDDILCRHRDKPNRFTVVHLSWLGREEINNQHPSVEFDGDFPSFLRYEASFYER